MERDDPAGTSGIGPGTVLNGTYRIERKLGSGGMGDVWLATNIEIAEQDAVKVIKAEWANQPKIAALLRKEAKALRLLAVPEIALFRACATDQQLNALYLVTEYVNGNPLTDRINGSPDTRHCRCFRCPRLINLKCKLQSLRQPFQPSRRHD